MGRNQKGFKSPVYRMKNEEQKKLLTLKSTTRSQLREGDRPWGGRLWESHQAMNKNLIRGRRSGTSWHNTAKFPHSAPEVNEALGWRRFLFLSGETSSACGDVAIRLSAAVSNGSRDWRGVSRGHSNWKTSRSANRTEKIAGWTQPTKDQTNNGTPTRGTHPPQRTRKEK